MNAPTPEQTQAFIDAFLDMHCTAGVDGHFKWVSPGFSKLLGYSDRELLSRPVVDFVHPADREATDAVMKALAGGEIVHLFRNRYRTSDGSYRWLQWNALTLDDGTLYGSARDVTNEEALAAEIETRIRWLSLAERMAGFGHWSLDVESQQMHWSDELLRIYGYESGAVTPSLEAVLEAFVDGDRAHAERCFDETFDNHAGFEFELRIRRQDGALRWLEMVGATVVNDEGKLVSVSGVARDSTESRRMRDNMLATERTASVATLASGIAHEINNPLTYVLANLEILGRELTSLNDVSASARDELLLSIGDALEGGTRIANIVQGLKRLARSESEHDEVISLVTCLDSAVQLLSNEIRHRASLVHNFKFTPNVCCRASELLQAFTHLIINAVHSMPLGQADQNSLTVSVEERDGSAVVSISDTGEGIDEGTLSRVLDPFFSTKPIGEGTGLGLSVCNAIVQAAGGNLELESSVGFGTTARVILPVFTDDKTEVCAPTEDAVETSSTSLRILVVDDEERLGRAIQRMMASPHHVAHEVESVTSGYQALHLIGEGKEYDVILCDLMMPVISGQEFYETLEARHPALCSRVVFMSGGAFTGDARAFAKKMAHRLLAKPLSRSELEPAMYRAVAQSKQS